MKANKDNGCRIETWPEVSDLLESLRASLAGGSHFVPVKVEGHNAFEIQVRGIRLGKNGVYTVRGYCAVNGQRTDPFKAKLKADTKDGYFVGD